MPVADSHHTEPSTQGTNACLQIKWHRVACVMQLRTSSATKPWQQPYRIAVSLGRLQAPFGTSVNFRHCYFWSFLKFLSLFFFFSFPPPSPRYNAMKWCKACATAYQANSPRAYVASPGPWFEGMCEGSAMGMMLLLPHLTTGNSLKSRKTSEFHHRTIGWFIPKKISGLNRECEMIKQWRYSHPPAGSQPGNLILLLKLRSESFWYMKDRLCMCQNMRYFCFTRQTDNDVWAFPKFEDDAWETP